MHERRIFADEVRNVLINGEIIESYIDDKPFPSYLVFGHIKDKKPLHIVVSLDLEEERLWVITVYNPSPDEWEKGFKRRKIK